MCKGFGVIDGVLFAGGCEAPAELELLETQGTLPLSPPRSEPEPSEPQLTPAEASGASDPQNANDEPAPPVEKKAAKKKSRASSKSGSTKKSKTTKTRRKKRQP
jgi:hypothetical protein